MKPLRFGLALFSVALFSVAFISACGDKREPAAQGPAGAAPAAAPVPASSDLGRIRYAGVCLSCHGPKAEGQGPFPKLAGKSAEELADTLKDYRAGKTRGPQSATMFPFAQVLRDDEIEALARYISSL